jgi:hypothetical protein
MTMIPMPKKSSTVQIELTAEQREQIAAAAAKDRVAIRLTLEELEVRIAPLACCDGRHIDPP